MGWLRRRQDHRQLRSHYLDGNRGADTISGGVGDDRIHADDGSGGDVVDCGEDIGDTDNDTVYYDVGDQIDSNCETKDAF